MGPSVATWLFHCKTSNTLALGPTADGFRPMVECPIDAECVRMAAELLGVHGKTEERAKPKAAPFVDPFEHLLKETLSAVEVSFPVRGIIPANSANNPGREECQVSGIARCN